MAAQLRIAKELCTLDLPNVMTLQQMDDLKWTITYTPVDGIWNGRDLNFVLTFPTSYPIDPPRLHCQQPFPFHPNVSPDNGAVCLNILRLDWSPAMGIQAILLGLEVLFMLDLVADTDDCLNQEAARLLIADPEAFILKNKI